MQDKKNRKVDCELCKLVFDDRVITRFYIETEYWYVVDCKKCKSPMAVLKSHGKMVLSQALGDLLAIWLKHFPEMMLRTQMKNIPDHLHFHFVEEG